MRATVFTKQDPGTTNSKGKGTGAQGLALHSMEV
jgi:hypothetical protein